MWASFRLASRPIHQLRSDPSVARDGKLECGAVWDGDFSASFPPDKDGNTIICKWFERKHQMPLFTFHPRRSTPTSSTASTFCIFSSPSLA